MAKISRLPISPAFPSLIQTSILPEPAINTTRRLIAANNTSAVINNLGLKPIALSKEQIAKIIKILEVKDAAAKAQAQAFSERTGIKSPYPMVDKESTKKAVKAIGDVLRNTGHNLKEQLSTFLIS